MNLSYQIKSVMTTQWRLWVTVGLFILIGIYIQHLNVGELFDKIIQGWWKLLVMLPISGMAYLSATLAWKYCLDQNNIPLRRLFVARHIGESLALINPTNVIAGDLSKVLVLDNYDVDKDQGLSSVIISRVLIILSGIILSCLAFLLWLLMFFPQEDLWVMAIWPAIGILMVYIMWRMVTHRKLFLYGLSKSIFFPINKYPGIKKVLLRIKMANVLIVLKNNHQKSRLLKSLIYSVIHWLIGAAEFYVLLLLLGIDIGFSGSLILEMGVTVIKNAGAFIPGQLGIEEMGNKVMLSVIGVTSPVLWILVSAYKRARQLSWLIVGGIMYLFTTLR